MVAYVPVFPMLYGHMLAQRRKVLNPRKQDWSRTLCFRRFFDSIELNLRLRLIFLCTFSSMPLTNPIMQQ